MAVVMFISVFNIECLYAVQSFDGGQSIPDSVHGDAGSGSESEDEFGYTKSEWQSCLVEGRKADSTQSVKFVQVSGKAWLRGWPR